MTADAIKESRRPDALLPALLVIAPFFVNKLIYAWFPGYLVFLLTDYSCRIVSLGLLYLVLRNATASLPIPFRLAIPSGREFCIGLAGTIILIGSNVVSQTLIRYWNAHSWVLTAYPAPTNLALQYFDNTVGMVLVGLSEEVVFRFYLINLLLSRGASKATAVILSTLIFAAIHWSYGAGSMMFSCLAGLVLSIIFIATRNLIVPILAHAAFDATYFAGGIAALWRIYNRL
jgi:membrane protease YdiL (CAAX protease family)